jgi:hypothetical protein
MQSYWGERGRHSESVFTFVAKRTCPKDRPKKHQWLTVSTHLLGFLNTSCGASGPRPESKRACMTLAHSQHAQCTRYSGLKAVQRLLRHSDIATTSRFDIDALLDEVRNAMEVPGFVIRTLGPSRRIIGDKRSCWISLTQVAPNRSHRTGALAAGRRR